MCVLQGTEQWAGVVAKAMTFGGRDQGKSMQAFKTFQSNVMTSLQKKVRGSRPSCSSTRGQSSSLRCEFQSIEHYPVMARRLHRV